MLWLVLQPVREFIIRDFCNYLVPVLVLVLDGAVTRLLHRTEAIFEKNGIVIVA
jgi:hypothetical protein